MKLSDWQNRRLAETPEEKYKDFPKVIIDEGKATQENGFYCRFCGMRRYSVGHSPNCKLGKVK